MNDFIYQNTTKIYFGRDQLKNLGAELRKYSQRVLFVYGGGSIKKIGLYDKVQKEIEASGLKSLAWMCSIRIVHFRIWMARMPQSMPFPISFSIRSA